MIPKIIHYIWFGGNPYPDKIKKCIDSWQRFLPEYEFKLWNEETFSIANSCDFVKQAYENKKWAFVSDYVRVWALNKFGGWYLDTDVEVLQPFNTSLLSRRMVLGSDHDGQLTALMASEKGHPLWLELLDTYAGMQFLLPDGSFNQEVNNHYIQDRLALRGWKVENTRQSLADGIEVFPDDWFHAANHMTGQKHITCNTYAIHWHTLTWCPIRVHRQGALRRHILIPLLGPRLGMKLYNKLNNLRHGK